MSIVCVPSSDWTIERFWLDTTSILVTKVTVCCCERLCDWFANTIPFRVDVFFSSSFGWPEFTVSLEHRTPIKIVFCFFAINFWCRFTKNFSLLCACTLCVLAPHTNRLRGRYLLDIFWPDWFWFRRNFIEWRSPGDFMAFDWFRTFASDYVNAAERAYHNGDSIRSLAISSA